MKKILIIGTVLTIIIIIALVVWAIIGGLGFLREKAPQWLTGGEKLATEVIKKAEEAVPGIKEKAKEVVPGITEKVKELAPLRLPEKDVGGEDIKGIPRYPDMVRTFYEIKDQKRTVVYKGKVDFQSVIEHFNKEMTVLGFKKKVVSASSEEEIHIYKKAKKELEFRFKKIGLIGIPMTELTIREM